MDLHIGVLDKDGLASVSLNKNAPCHALAAICCEQWSTAEASAGGGGGGHLTVQRQLSGTQGLVHTGLSEYPV